MKEKIDELIDKYNEEIDECREAMRSAGSYQQSIQDGVCMSTLKGVVDDLKKLRSELQ